MKTAKTFVAVSAIGWLIASSVHATVVGYWRFQEGSSGNAITSATDSSPSGGWTLTNAGTGSAPTYAATPFANPVPQTGAANTLGASFTLGGGYLANTGFNALATATSFTIEMFFRGDTSPAYTDRGVLTVNGLTVFSYSNNDPVRGTLLDFNDGHGYDGGFWVAPGTHHLAIVRDGTTGKYSVYMDNTLVPGTVAPGIQLTSLYSGIAVGARVSPFGAMDSFPGMIDELRISNTALTPNQFLDTAVPEPSVVLLLAVGGLLVFRRCSASYGGQGRRRRS